LGKGAALGTTLAFMMSVIALSLPEMIILKQVLTLRLIAIFLAVVAAGINHLRETSLSLHPSTWRALPITETGYRSHFIVRGYVSHHGGAVAFVTAWLDHEAERTGWSNAQLSFF
jgi:hypothetical protein